MKKLDLFTIFLLLVFALAMALRFWHINYLEYNYDELSAIFRGNVGSWREHIQIGVMPDGHPAGLQTLIYLSGSYPNVTFMKSISAALGVLAVFFVYKTGKCAFNAATGLFAAAMMATTYLPVYWSQQARPYAYGMALATCLLYIFSQIQFQKKTNNRTFLYFAVIAAATAYIHYFAALFSIIIYLSGFIFSTKENKLKWILTGALGLLLFLPHYPISWHQLTTGSLGWLGKPNFYFFYSHLLEIFGRSEWLIFIVFIFTLTGIISIFKIHYNQKAQLIRAIVFLIFFILPMLIGFVWSHWKSPVLQHSVLLFSLPCLFIALSYCISMVPAKIFRINLILFIVCSLAVLIQGRQHYTIGYREPYSSAIQEMITLNKIQFANNAQVFYNGPEDIVQYYWEKFCADNTSLKIHALPLDKNSGLPVDSALNKKTSIILFNSGSNPALLPYLDDKKILAGRHYFAGAEYAVTKVPNTAVKQQNSYTTLTQHKSANMAIAMKNLGAEQNDLILIKFQKNPSENSADSMYEIQTALKNNTEQIDWRSSKANAPFHIIKLADIPNWCGKTTLHIKVIRKDGEIANGNISYRIFKGNPYLYGYP